MQRVESDDGVVWINDSKATNEAAAVSSLNSLAGPLVLIAGGDAKGAGFSVLADVLRGKNYTAILLGRDADSMAGDLAGACTVMRAENIEEAVNIAAGIAGPGYTVLLAPACSSQDMFADFAERGDRFSAAVRGLCA